MGDAKASTILTHILDESSAADESAVGEQPRISRDVHREHPLTGNPDLAFESTVVAEAFINC